MTPPRQLALDLAHRPALSVEDFLVSASNRAAYEAVTAPLRSDSRLALSGPAGAGKTHLASIWGAATGAVRLTAATLTDQQVALLGDAAAVVIEDADQLASLPPDARDEAERLLFHSVNLVSAHDLRLLITARSAPARWRTEMPDLTSRLATLPHVAIIPPDDELLAAILAKLFTDRQLTVGQEAIRFLVMRMERTFAAAERVVTHLDRLALAEKRAITRNFAMELYDADPGVITGTGEP